MDARRSIHVSFTEKIRDAAKSTNAIYTTPQEMSPKIFWLICHKSSAGPYVRSSQMTFRGSYRMTNCCRYRVLLTEVGYTIASVATQNVVPPVPKMVDE